MLNILKGALKFQKHTRHSIYDPVNPWNQVLYKTLLVLNHLNIHPALQNRMANLLLHFPEMPDIKVNDSFFNRLKFNRKTERYRQAMNIARLILLNYHPDVRHGHNDVLALMFDMNKLWEQWVLRTLQRELKPLGYTVKGQKSTKFWQSESADVSNKYLKPDIIIQDPQNEKVVIDTKWKTPDKRKGPADDDLRQLYAYQKYYHANEGILLYPGHKDQKMRGQFEGAALKCHQVFRHIHKDGKAVLNGEALVKGESG